MSKMVVIAAILSFVTVVILVIGLDLKSERQVIWDRMQKKVVDEGIIQNAVALEMGLSFGERVTLPFLSRLAKIAGKFTPSGATKEVEWKLIAAGRPYGMGPLEFQGIRIVSVVGFIGLAILGIGFAASPGIKMIALCFCLFAGIFLPNYMLGQAINTRHTLMRKALPETLDLLTVSVEAGLGLDGAMQTAVEKMKTPLSEEMHRALREMRVGKLRVEALRDMATRVGLSELTAFVAAVCQADQLGGSISRVLRVQSAALRVRRMQRAREVAAKLPVKMLFPLVIFIFPAVFVVVLAPGALQIMRTMAFK
jgi:tight adherence protein C